MGNEKRGCFGRLFGCLFSLILGGAIMIGVAVAIQAAWRSIGAYEHAMEQARSSKKVLAITGKPLEDGIMLLPQIQVEGANGYAKMDIPVSGPKGAGTVHVDALKQGGKWTYQELSFESDGGKKVDLRGK